MTIFFGLVALNSLFEVMETSMLRGNQTQALECVAVHLPLSYSSALLRPEPSCLSIWGSGLFCTWREALLFSSFELGPTDCPTVSPLGNGLPSSGRSLFKHPGSRQLFLNLQPSMVSLLRPYITALSLGASAWSRVFC